VRTHLHRGRKRLSQALSGRRGGARTENVEDEADERIVKGRTFGGMLRQGLVGRV